MGQIRANGEVNESGGLEKSPDPLGLIFTGHQFHINDSRSDRAWACMDQQALARMVDATTSLIFRL